MKSAAPFLCVRLQVSEYANLRDEYLLSVEQPPARAPIRSLCQVSTFLIIILNKYPSISCFTFVIRYIPLPNLCIYRFNFDIACISVLTNHPTCVWFRFSELTEHIYLAAIFSRLRYLVGCA
jgi:hypothetical protein